MTDFKCRCGYHHYNFQHWSKIHGQGKGYIDPLIKVPFVNDKLWDKKEYDSTEPYPLITYKWICQFCGQEKGHKQDYPECSFWLNYPEFFKPLSGERKWEVPHYPVKSSYWNFDDEPFNWERFWAWWFKKSDWEKKFDEPSTL